MNDKSTFDDLMKLAQAIKLAGGAAGNTESYSVDSKGNKSPLHAYRNPSLPTENGSGVQAGSEYSETENGALILYQKFPLLKRTSGCCPEKWAIDDENAAKCCRCGRLLCSDHRDDMILNYRRYCISCGNKWGVKLMAKIQRFTLDYVKMDDQIAKRNDIVTKSMVASQRETKYEPAVRNNSPHKQICDQRR
jgi:hypothetical protein